ncbi:phosphoribosylformylglycinamidine synthase subunit PurL [Fonticella tunisiensis]|uniref:Phosphoribosylformylglycinamidine synthase subunit PurL n=1 Tax=Fonticella tunisiensis TaxID=1096341 RepID=A0A4R7KRV4_9CLOT|nr:phosphoribosylformylglycinamidine synthase subunit PurL [Fonticella tunisiensis]TDT62324.1 phosphoribosylformylglycinamidine synthase subunit II [Fonticella tunisiensis]
MKPYKMVGLLEEEYNKIVEILGREPNETELAMYGVMWSEHCSYKNSRALLKLFNTKGLRVLQGPGENAGIVDIGDGFAIAMKIESHNHPSAVEPYQGAATGVGGILRDIFTMGARPIANLNSIRFGELKDEKTKKLLRGIVRGIGDYGNCVGIPTISGETVFNKCYNDNPLVNAMSVGILEKKDIKKGTARGVGNSVMLVGHTTGRDGIGGASFASCDLTRESEENRSAVQVGDPFMEKLLMEACLELIKTDCVVGIQDLGAAGLTSASCETASRGGSGIEIDVARVITREKGMTPREIMISESQERMLVIVEKGKEDKVFEIFNKWGLHAVVIGRVTDDGMLRVLENGKVVAEVPASSLADGSPVNYRSYRRPKYMDKLSNMDIANLPCPENLSETLITMLKSPNIASKEWVYSQYDYMVGTDTVVVPGGDAGVLRIKGTKKGIALTVDCNSRYCYLNPYEGAKSSVCEAARNITASGGRPIAITDCLNFASPEDEGVYYQFRNSILGINEASRILDTPVISGNVSFYNQSEKMAIYPTPTIGMVGIVENIENSMDIHFKDKGDSIILVGETKAEIGGSEYLSAIYGIEAGRVPEVHVEIEKNTNEGVLSAIEKGLIKSAHDISDGGFIVALSECCFKNELGVNVNIDTELREDIFLFSESQGRYILTASKDNIKDIIEIFTKLGVQAEVVGEVIDSDFKVNINGRNVINLNIKEMKSAWKGSLPCIMNQ